LTDQYRSEHDEDQVQRIRNLAISLHRLAGATNIAKALRHHARDARRPLQLLKIVCREHGKGKPM
jgi:hypothetical protein